MSVIYRDGERVGWLSSGGFGCSIGKPLGYGYVRHPLGVSPEFVCSANYELEVAGERVCARASLDPFFDPRGTRPRA